MSTQPPKPMCLKCRSLYLKLQYMLPLSLPLLDSSSSPSPPTNPHSYPVLFTQTIHSYPKRSQIVADYTMAIRLRLAQIYQKRIPFRVSRTGPWCMGHEIDGPAQFPLELAVAMDFPEVVCGHKEMEVVERLFEGFPADGIWWVENPWVGGEFCCFEKFQAGDERSRSVFGRLMGRLRGAPEPKSSNSQISTHLENVAPPPPSWHYTPSEDPTDPRN
ncbi:hypothetical protein BDW59DRAFT_163659 [Aspergillus cavernicola]|uniref:Uncharacterized protein n=1 Tax=Aspergillus cavernicola TaxID=176166 RepID=A0ABR4I4X0_9EURO